MKRTVGFRFGEEALRRLAILAESSGQTRTQFLEGFLLASPLPGDPSTARVAKGRLVDSLPEPAEYHCEPEEVAPTRQQKAASVLAAAEAAVGMKSVVEESTPVYRSKPDKDAIQSSQAQLLGGMGKRS